MSSNLLESVTAGNLVANKTSLVVAALDDSVETVLGKLLTYNIISVPLVNESGQFVGIISLQDIVLDLVWRPEEKSKLPSSLSRQVRDVFALREEAKQLWVFEASEPLSRCLEPFSNGVHRALVPQSEDTSRATQYRMLSQSNILGFISEHKSDFVRLLSQTLEDLGIGKKYTLETVNSDAKTFDCFKKLGDEYKKVSAVPIVDKDTGELVGNLSASDLRGLNVSKLHFLGKSLETFLLAQHGSVRTPISCKMDATLESVVDLIITNNIHRVWIVEDSKKPVGVVTLTDIIDVVRKQFVASQ